MAWTLDILVNLSEEEEEEEKEGEEVALATGYNP